MKKYIQFINEGVQEVENVMAGKNGFHIFLEIVADNDIDWTKKSYLNTGEYFYFFRSEHIKDNSEIAEQLELKRSLKTAYLTLRTITNKRLCFYFGVKNDKLEYGFYDETEFTVYKIGIFAVNNFYFKKNLPKESNLSIIKKALEDVNFKRLALLHQIRIDLMSFWTQVESKTELLNEMTVRRSLPVEDFKSEDATQSNMIDALSYNIKNFEWNDRTESYVEITDENIYFYVRVL